MVVNEISPAIVIVTFNRPDSLSRLLRFISEADYSNYQVPLVISIDYQDSSQHKEVVEISEKFDWKFGTKTVIKRPSNMGLRKHVLACGDLSNEYGSIIMLEDDLVVSPLFYRYAVLALNYYENDSFISGIALYSHKSNFCIDLPFTPIEDGYDVFFLQIAASWGQGWTSDQWNQFRDWYDTKNDITGIDMPDRIKNWPETSWVKYYVQYLVEKDKYFVYPKVSLTANLGVPGTHHKSKEYTYSVPFLLGNKSTFGFQPFSKSENIYDSYFELTIDAVEKIAPEYGIQCVDLYGLKDLSKYSGQKVLSIKKIQDGAKSAKLFSSDLKPAFMNIKFGLEGKVFGIAKADDFVNSKKVGYSEHDWDYYFGKIRIREFLTVMIAKLKQKVR